MIYSTYVCTVQYTYKIPKLGMCSPVCKKTISCSMIGQRKKKKKISSISTVGICMIYDPCVLVPRPLSSSGFQAIAELYNHTVCNIALLLE